MKINLSSEPYSVKSLQTLFTGEIAMKLLIHIMSLHMSEDYLTVFVLLDSNGDGR